MPNFFTKHTAKIHLGESPADTRIEIDGKLIENAVFFSVSQRVCDLPILRLDLITSVDIDGEVIGRPKGPMLGNILDDNSLIITPLAQS